MAILVDKDKKRRDIANASKELLLDKGIKKITVVDIAKSAKVGKGTVYSYFTSKEDIVLEIMDAFLDEYKKELNNLINSDLAIEEKLNIFFYGKFERFKGKKINIFLEFTAILISENSENFIKQYKKVKSLFEISLKNILNLAIKKGELKDDVIEFIPALLAFNFNIIKEHKLLNIDTKKEIEQFVNMTVKIYKKENK